MVQSIQAQNISLEYLAERFKLQKVNNETFFPEWLDNCKDSGLNSVPKNGMGSIGEISTWMKVKKIPLDNTEKPKKTVWVNYLRSRSKPGVLM